MDAAQALGDLRRLAGLWVNMGTAESNRGHLLQAIAHEKKALEAYERMGDRDGIAVTHANLGAAYTLIDEPKHHVPFRFVVSQGATIWSTRARREILALINRAGVLLTKGMLDQAEGELKRAEGLCRHSLRTNKQPKEVFYGPSCAYRRQQFTDGLKRVDGKRATRNRRRY